MSDDLIDRFVNVFRGRADVYGNAKGFCVKEPLTRAVFERHLTSTDPSKHIGVYCMVNDMCSWGCIDIDGKDFPCPECHGQGYYWAEGNPDSAAESGCKLLEVSDPFDGTVCIECHICSGAQWDWTRLLVLALNLQTVLSVADVPAHIERSKNGYHVWVFPEEPLVSAATMRRALMAACTAIGYSPKEVNPKAEGPRLGTKGYGNMVRLPYGGALNPSYEPTARYMLVTSDRCKPWKLSDFLDGVQRASTANLEAISKLWTPPPPPRTQVDYEAGLDAEAAVAKLNGLAYTIWLDGPLPGKDRSNTLAQLAHLCAECALTSSEAFAVLKSADERWGKFHLRDDCDDQLARLIQGAYE